MRKLLVFSSVCAAFWSSATFLACSGDDTDVGSHDAGNDATAYDGPLLDRALPPDDASDAGDAASPPPPYLLLSYNYDNYSKTEYSAFSLTSGTVAGNLQYAMYGTNMSGGKSPWVLDQAGDVVRKMDATKPWITASTWNVAMPSPIDGGKPNANPWSVAEAGDKAYVAFFNRNTIAVLDTTQASDGGAPSKTIDVSALHQAADSDGFVELTSAVYVPAHERVYLLVGNVDLNNVGANGFFQLCGPTKAVIAAIDVKTDSLVSDDAGIRVIPLQGVSPAPQTLVYDAKNDRLLVTSTGCNDALPDDAGPDAGKGPLRGRMIEEVRLTDGATKVLLDLTTADFPTLLAYADETHAWVQVGGVTHAWDPTSTTLGAVVTAPDSFVYDGKGSLVGPRANYLADGGFGGIDIIAVQTGDGGVTTIGANPVSHGDPAGYFEGIGLWP